jgi:hypothetical protein
MPTIRRRSALKLLGVSLVMPPVLEWAESIRDSKGSLDTSALTVHNPEEGYADRLETYFPGITKLQRYKLLLANSCLISNTTERPLRGFALTWTGVSQEHGALVYSRRYANRPSLVTPRHITAGRPAIPANSQAFVTPFFSVDSHTYSSLKNRPAYLPKPDPVRQLRVRKLIKSVAPGTALRPEITGVLYGNSATGPKAGVLAKHVTLCRNAEHDASLGVTRHFVGETPSITDLRKYLSSAIEIGTQKSAKGARGIYYRAHLRYLRYLWDSLNTRGASYVVATATRVSKTSHAVIKLA